MTATRGRKRLTGSRYYGPFGPKKILKTEVRRVMLALGQSRR
jgi:hypothetical protein